MTFKEPVHKILERIKNKPYFWWPSKIGGDPTRRNQNLYCTYHQDKGHTTKQCRIFKDSLEQLVNSRHLNLFIVDPEFITHKLNMNPAFPSNKQKLRRSAR